MNSPIVIVLFSTLFFTLGSADYCWHDYNYKKIPPDAVVAGVDKYGNNIYVGQVYVLDAVFSSKYYQSYKGIVPCQINSYNPTVYVELGGVTPHNKYIKILAGPRGQFEWYPTTSSELADVIKSKTPVLGGYEKSNQESIPDFEYAIGRFTYGGETVVGKIHYVHKKLYFADSNHQPHTSDSFDILLFKDLEECDA